MNTLFCRYGGMSKAHAFPSGATRRIPATLPHGGVLDQPLHDVVSVRFRHFLGSSQNTFFPSSQTSFIHCTFN